MSQEDRDRYAATMDLLSKGIRMEFEQRMLLEEHGLANYIANLRLQSDTAHIAVSAMFALLLRKGLVSVDEFEAEHADQAETEKRAYEERLSALHGIRMTLR